MRHSLVVFSIAITFSVAGCGKDRRPADPPLNPKGDQIGTTKGVVKNWFTKDSVADGVEGTSADRAYTELGLKTGVTPIIVAVIDSGVDIDHEDLKDQIWTNPGEIPGNNIDDDKNGYVDDIHGWNFLGSVDANGKAINIDQTTLEMTREKVRLTKLKSQRPLTTEEQALLDEVSKRVTDEYTTADAALKKNEAIKANMSAQYEILKSVVTVSLDDLTLDIVKAIDSKDQTIIEARDALAKIFTDNNLVDVARVNRRIDYFGTSVKYYYNENFDPRATIIGDNPYDLSNPHYGNNDVEGPDADHGTHVSGIIGAVRNNGIGIDGIATDVRIMVLRAVPNGDEYDKDIINSVRYAVNNGARVINMSFGKAYSPLKKKVDEAFKYAADHGVLLVHAAGNDSQNNDTAANFPNRKIAGTTDEVAGWIEVGASSSDRGPDLPADFSNFGKNSVVLFAPGVDLESTIPEGNKYASYSGTSMASPSTAGVAALVLSQTPSLSAVELKDALTASVKTYNGLNVNLPGTQDLVLFSELSITGGIVNAYEAMKVVLHL